MLNFWSLTPCCDQRKNLFYYPRTWFSTCKIETGILPNNTVILISFMIVYGENLLKVNSSPYNQYPITNILKIKQYF